MGHDVAPSLSCLVEVDGRCFSVHLAGGERPLEVEASTGERVHLARWRLEDYLGALDHCVRFDGRDLEFNHVELSRELLRRSDVPEALFEELAPLALWWAAGGGQPAGAVQARLRAWTFAERSKALGSSLVTQPDGSRELSLKRYLRSMLATCVVALEPSDRSWMELDGADAAALLDAVVTLNAPGEEPDDRATARTVLRLCRALGWTPSQVGSTPAAEVQRLLALLEIVEGEAPPAAPLPQGLAAHPDAVVIQLEDH
jgi:hypothetical protein